MTKPISFSSPEFNLVSSMTRSEGEVAPETPFRILVMGDFSGRTNRGNHSQGVRLSQPRLLQVDRDNLDEVMARMGVELRLPLMGLEAPPTIISFSELDDFHPDRLYERLEVFRTLKEHVSSKPLATGTGATMGITERATPFKSTVPLSQADLASVIVGQSTGSLLDQVLEETEGGGATASTLHSSELDRFLSGIVRPHLAPDTDKEEAARNSTRDAAIRELMRAILHYPDFQELEAVWRGIAFLTSRLETGEDVQLFLLDVTKSELADDLRDADNLGNSGLHPFLVEKTTQTPGAIPWALLAGLFTFDGCREDVTLLAKLSRLASSAGAPFIAAAAERVVGCASLAATPDPRDWRSGSDADAVTWMALRRLSTASYLGLVLPRFLLRLPYGAATDPLDSFDFEEMTSPREHEQYLWGNPALAVAFLLGQTFSEVGWGMRPGVIQDIENLPLHIYKKQGESVATPCAETLLTYDAADLLMEWGLMPLVSFKDRDMARLARFSSLADPPSGLAGRWNTE